MNLSSPQLAHGSSADTPWPRITASIPTCRILPGSPSPLGATWNGDGVNVALVSKHGTRVWLSLFDSPDSTQPSLEIELPERAGNVWHGYFPDLKPGQLYGFRVE